METWNDGWMDDTDGSFYQCVESGQADMGRREEKKMHTVVSFSRLLTVTSGHIIISCHITLCVTATHTCIQTVCLSCMCSYISFTCH